MTVFSCHATVFALYLFSNTVDYNCRSTADDILIQPLWESCRCWNSFKGRTLLINGEDGVIARKPNVVVIGRSGITVSGSIGFPYGLYEHIHFSDTVITPVPRIMAVAYVASNCVHFKQSIAETLARHVPVHTYGKCRVANGIYKGRLRGTWSTTIRLYAKYAFVIAADHSYVDGYVTEKVFMAAKAGSIPIYRGDVETASFYLNNQRLLFWNETTTPQRVNQLLHNFTEYTAMAAQPTFRYDHIKLARKKLLNAIPKGHLRRR